MVNILFLVYILFHILGDFYFQSKSLSIEKENSLKKLFLHSLIYGVVILAPFIILNFNIIIFIIISLLLGLSHFCIDFLKTSKFIKMIINKFCNRFNIKLLLFVVDQALHIVLIWLVINIFYSNFNTLNIIINHSNIVILRWICAIAFIGKPANVIFKIIFGDYNKNKVQEEITIAPKNEGLSKNSGAVIGFLERMLILICIINGFYTSIGLILTAKSITRYNKISIEPAFAEYYLIGTLSSLLFTIVSYWLFFIVI